MEKIESYNDDEKRVLIESSSPNLTERIASAYRSSTNWARENWIFMASSAYFAIGNGMDYITTKIGVEQFGAQESNPLANFLLDVGGMNAIGTAKVGITLAGIGFFYKLNNRSDDIFLKHAGDINLIVTGTLFYAFALANYVNL
ncbi:MAG: DUF5658 family protein [archaeon]